MRRTNPKWHGRVEAVEDVGGDLANVLAHVQVTARQAFVKQPAPRQIVLLTEDSSARSAFVHETVVDFAEHSHLGNRHVLRIHLEG